jgi:hypothetical protein
MFGLLIKLRYQCYIHACFENYLGNILLLFFLFFRFFYVKRPDGYPERLDVYSGCLNDTGSSSKRFWLSSGRPCFRNHSRGTTFGHYLCSVWTVNPVELNHFLPAPQLTFWPPFVLFCCLMHSSHVHMSNLQFISTLGIFLFFYYLILFGVYYFDFNMYFFFLKI